MSIVRCVGSNWAESLDQKADSCVMLEGSDTLFLGGNMAEAIQPECCPDAAATIACISWGGYRDPMWQTPEISARIESQVGPVANQSSPSGNARRESRFSRERLRRGKQEQARPEFTFPTKERTA